MPAFVYDPSSGSLLLDVVTNSSDINNGFNASAEGTGDSSVGRIYNIGGDGTPTAGPGSGLRTQFVTSPAAVVPEASALALFGAASVIPFAAVARRRRSARLS